MNKEMQDWIRSEFPQKANNIIRNALPEYITMEAGIQLKDREVFVRYYPKHGFEDYAISNYGRALSLKGNVPTLLSDRPNSDGYVIHSFSRPSVKLDGAVIEEGMTFGVSASRALGDVFLPNFWKEMERKELAVHHLNHVRWENVYWNLILCCGEIHYWLDRISQIWFYTDGVFQVNTPYQIQRKTDMSLEDIILPVRREPDMVGWQDGHKIYVYDLDGWFVGYELTESELQKREGKY